MMMRGLRGKNKVDVGRLIFIICIYFYDIVVCVSECVSE